MKKVLYFHGGPGLNSNPERNLLKERYASAGINLLCWDEPSRLRTSGTSPWKKYDFKEYLNSSEDFFLQNHTGSPLCIMAHSFGSHAALYQAQKHPDKIATIIFVSSDLSLEHADQNMFTFTMLDYKEHGDTKYKDLENIIANYSGKFDQNTFHGFQLLLENPRLFDYYWSDKIIMNRFLNHYSGPAYAIDVESFFSVRKSFYILEKKRCSKPIVSIYGSDDIVISKNAEIVKLGEYFQNIEVFTVENAAHYPHLEQFDQCLSIILNELHKY